MKNGLKGKMATMLCVPYKAIIYDKSVDALVCTCGCGMEVSTIALRGILCSQESRVYLRLHWALKAGVR